MTDRKSLSKTVRFEVFKRDRFTCQYCGAKAPDVVLQADHIKPVAEGGTDEILNLATACVACNGGKGARLLSDDSVVEKQRKQIEELQERREQLEMMLQWRDQVSALQTDYVDVVAKRLSDRGCWTPNESGRGNIRRWLKNYSLEEILIAVDEAMDIYLRFEDDAPTKSSWEQAFAKIPGIVNIRRQEKEKPYLRRILYIQGILRRRCRSRYMSCVDALESLVLDGASVDAIEGLAKRCSSWEEFATSAEALVPKKEGDA